MGRKCCADPLWGLVCSCFFLKCCQFFIAPTHPPVPQPSKHFTCFTRRTCLDAELRPAFQVSGQLATPPSSRCSLQQVPLSLCLPRCHGLPTAPGPPALLCLSVPVLCPASVLAFEPGHQGPLVKPAGHSWWPRCQSVGLANGEGCSVSQPRPCRWGCSRAPWEPLLFPAPRSTPCKRLVMFSITGKPVTVTAQLPVLRLEAPAAVANAPWPAPGHGQAGARRGADTRHSPVTRSHGRDRVLAARAVWGNVQRARGLG